MFGCGECDAFAANKFEAYCPDTNQRSVVNICACCHKKQLMKDGEGDNERLNEKLYPDGIVPSTHVVVPR